VDAIENLVFEQTTGIQGLRPQGIGRAAIFGEKTRQHDRRIQINQRSLRLSSRSRINSSKDIKGSSGGSGAPGGIFAGVIKPCRTRLAITWSADIVAEDPGSSLC
jgi:hypothetical protein